jgi:hypothetical protein
VPKEVADAARELARRDPPVISPAILKALATNKRMKWVWRELSKRKDDGGYKHRVRALPKRLARPTTDAEWQTAGMVFLFSQAIEIMRAESSRPPMTASRKEAKMARDVHAKQARDLRKLAKTLGETVEYIPSDYPDPSRVEAYQRRISEEMRTLEDAAKIIDEFTQVEDEAAAEFPARDHGTASKRRVTGELIKLCRALFGKDLSGTVATIASTLFETNIPEPTVRAWHCTPVNKTP